MINSRIEEKFRAIGVDVCWSQTPERPYWHDPVEPIVIRVVKNRRGQEQFLFEVIAKAQKHLAIDIACIDRQAKSLIVSLRFFQERKRFLCRHYQGHWEATEIPHGTGGGIRQAVEALEKQEAKRLEEACERERLRDLELQRNGKQRRGTVHRSFEELQNDIGLTEDDYGFYLQLLAKCHKLRLLQQQGRPVFPQYGSTNENTFDFALIRVAILSSHRLRDINDWQAKSHNPHKQFGSLVRHLYAGYPVPEFMDSVWFRKDESWLSWFITVGNGANIRKVKDFPLPYTKKMAHMMMQAPANLTVEEAIRWGQVMALGGNQRFFQEMERTRIAAVSTIGNLDSERHAFWQTVMEWFLRHAMLDPTHYGPIVDFVEHQKFAAPQANPSFEVTGRSPQALLGLLNQWHGTLGAASRQKKTTWSYHGLDWTWEQKLHDDVQHTWEVREILDSHELLAEGKQMHHCVYTYTDSCTKGRSIILSLRCDGKRTLTIEYLPQVQRFGEVRGHCNRRPAHKELGVVRRWAQAKGLHKAWLLMS